jgi:hypothetical protein
MGWQVTGNSRDPWMCKNRLAVHKMCWWVFLSQLCANSGHQSLPLGSGSVHTGRGDSHSPLPADMHREWRYGSTDSWFLFYLEVSGWVLTSTALPLGKIPGTDWIGGRAGPWGAVRKWMRGFRWPEGKAILLVNVWSEINLYCLPNETGRVTGFYGEEVGVGMWCFATAGPEADGACLV